MNNSGMVRDIRTIGLTYFCVFVFYVVVFFLISLYSEILKDLEQY